MKAIVLNRNLADKVELTDLVLPPLKYNEVKVALKAAALNRRDEWCRQGLYPNLKDGVVLGSDGAGVVSQIGKGVSADWLGKEVIINPAFSWGPLEYAKANEFGILGMPDHGTMAEAVQVPADRLHPKPSHLSWEEAASLPLAGLTAYRALFVQGQLREGENVLVTGIGGGVSQFVAQFAQIAGAKVYANSSNIAKISKATQLGVLRGFDYTDPDWVAQALDATGGFDLIVDSAMGDTLATLIDLAKPSGRIVLYGATRGNPGGFNARKVYWNQLTIKGSTMGSDSNFTEMLEFVNRTKIAPVIDSIFDLEEAVEGFERMKAGHQMGKIVIRIS